MYKTNFNFDLETIKGRSDAILKAIEIFGSESVLMRRGDGLTYIFDNVTEAILFTISDVKEEEGIIDSFNKCKITEMNMTKIIFISSTMSNYTIENMKSLKYFDNYFSTTLNMSNASKEDNGVSDSIKNKIISDIGDLRLSRYLNPAYKNSITITKAINKHINHWDKWWLELSPTEIKLCIKRGDKVIYIPYTR